VWFHRPVRAEQWHLYEMSCVNYVNGRGLAHGYVFSQDGTHVATVAQETLVRIAP
jgi:acyl-CoA thioesterase-2